MSTHQQVSGFAGDAVVIKIVRRMSEIMIHGRALRGAVFENIRQRGGLHSRR